MQIFVGLTSLRSPVLFICLLCKASLSEVWRRITCGDPDTSARGEISVSLRVSVRTYSPYSNSHSLWLIECEDFLLLHTQTRTHTGPLCPELDYPRLSRYFYEGEISVSLRVSVRTYSPYSNSHSRWLIECEDILLLHTQTRTHTGNLWLRDKIYFSIFLIIEKRIFDISSACE